MRKIFLFAALLLSACAHSSMDFKPDIDAADKKCSSQKWDSLAAKIDCQDSEETPIVEKDVPVATQAFEVFSSKRKYLAKKFDEEVAPAKGFQNRAEEGEKEGAKILSEHETRWGKDKDTALSKDIMAAAPPTACPNESLLQHLKCLDDITRPIWERDAPDSIESYNEFQKNRFRLAKEYDDSDAPKILALAKEHWQKDMKWVTEEFFANAKEAIWQQQATERQQQAADAQSSAENAAAAAQAINFVGELALAFLQGMAAGSPQATAPPTQTVQLQQQAQTTHTNCQWSPLFHQMQCTTTPY